LVTHGIHINYKSPWLYFFNGKTRLPLPNFSKLNPTGRKPHKGKTMFDIEKYTPPTDWSQVALWVVSIAAIVVIILDVLYWRA
jgi:hypothetical protein